VIPSSVILAGRAALKTWLESAIAHGTVYYLDEETKDSRSSAIERAGNGWYRAVTFRTIVPTVNPGPTLALLWPSAGPQGAPHEELQAIADDWGFSFKPRAFWTSETTEELLYSLADLCGVSHSAISKVHLERFNRT
jgi:hypothetical protein